MTASAARVPDPGPQAPPANARAIRACLSSDTAAVFDDEWEFVLEQAKHSQDLTGVQDLLHKWRFYAVEELRQPGWYVTFVAKAERILRTGVNPDARPYEDMQELIARRHGA